MQHIYIMRCTQV